MSRAEFAKELVAYGSSFFRKFVISVLHHIFSRKLSPIIDDSTGNEVSDISPRLPKALMSAKI